MSADGDGRVVLADGSGTTVPLPSGRSAKVDAYVASGSAVGAVAFVLGLDSLAPRTVVVIVVHVAVARLVLLGGDRMERCNLAHRRYSFQGEDRVDTAERPHRNQSSFGTFPIAHPYQAGVTLTGVDGTSAVEAGISYGGSGSV